MRLLLCLALLPGSALAETVVARHTIRANTILTEADLALQPTGTAGALDNIDLAIGQEARVTLYANRPIRPEDLGPPALVDRNQIVTLIYATGPLNIHAEGRALARGGLGDAVRVMNLSSRTTVSGFVAADGSVRVGPAP